MAGYRCRQTFCAIALTLSSIANPLSAAPLAIQQPEVTADAQLPESREQCPAKPPLNILPWTIISTTDEKEQETIAWAHILAIANPHDETAIAALTRVIEESENIDLAWAAQTLGEIDPENSLAVETLFDLYQSAETSLHTTRDNTRPDRATIAFLLGSTGPNNSLATTALIRILQESDHYLVLNRAFTALGDVGQGNETAITFLENTIESGLSANEPNKVWDAASALEEIDPGNPKAVSGLVTLFNQLEADPGKQRIVANALVKIAPRDVQTIRILRQYLSFSYKRDTRYWATRQLCEAGINDSEVVSTLLDLLTVPFAETARDVNRTSNRRLAVQQLQIVAKGNVEAIGILSRTLATEQEIKMRSQIAAILGEIDPGNEQAITALSEILDQYELGEYEDTYDPADDVPQQILAAERLAAIDPGSDRAISALRSILTSTSPPSIQDVEVSNLEPAEARRELENHLDRYAKAQSRAATSLIAATEEAIEETTDSKELAINSLIALLDLQSESAAYRATKALKEIGIGQPVAIEALEQTLSTSQSKNILGHAAGSLIAIDPNNSQATATLLSIIQNESGPFGTATSAADSLMSVGKDNPEVISALAEIVQNHPMINTRYLAAIVLAETNPGNPQVIALIRRMLEQASAKPASN